jgi:ATP-binding cassette, subfamily C (CFTR/MRP), member 4
MISIIKTTRLTGARQMMELKNRINSSGRVCDYKNVTLESPLCTANKYRPLKEWPHNAEIIFANFHMKLAPDSNYILKDLTFRIGPGERIGVVGGGKVFIVPALLRFAHNEGSIEIDDINIETLGLHDLRRAFSLIPSHPILFSGTLRSNLDPFDEKTDDEIWEALEHVEMKNSVSKLINGLNTEVERCAFDGVEKQLFYLARAVLDKNKILILEEDKEMASDLHPE